MQSKKKTAIKAYLTGDVRGNFHISIAGIWNSTYTCRNIDRVKTPKPRGWQQCKWQAVFVTSCGTYNHHKYTLPLKQLHSNGFAMFLHLNLDLRLISVIYIEFL